MTIRPLQMGAAAALALGGMLSLAAPAGAANHAYGACNWIGLSTPTSGLTEAFEGVWEDCAQVQARVQVYVGPGTTYVVGTAGANYSSASTLSGFINGSTRGQCANCSPAWSTWRAS